MKNQTEITELEKRLSEVKAILSEAKRTNGKSLYNIEDWNIYHDEQTQIEEDIKGLSINAISKDYNR